MKRPKSEMRGIKLWHNTDPVNYSSGNYTHDYLLENGIHACTTIELSFNKSTRDFFSGLRFQSCSVPGDYWSFRGAFQSLKYNNLRLYKSAEVNFDNLKRMWIK